MSELQAALDRMESGAPLPEEPWSWLWYESRRGPGIPEEDGGVALIPFKVWNRWWNARDRFRRRVNRELLQAQPVDCRVCGQEFIRRQHRQRRCPACIERSRAAGGR